MTVLELDAVDPRVIPPPPGSGCPLVDGWRIVIEGFYNPMVGSRMYGNDTYGAGVYGDLAGGILNMQYGANSYGFGVYGDLPATGDIIWNDITEPAIATTIDRGTRHGDQIVDVDRVVVDVVDDTFRLIDPAVPQHSHQLGVGKPIRVGVVDPAGVYYPLGTGLIDRFDDDHDVGPRLLAVEAFGALTDTVASVYGWNPPAGPADARANALFDAIDWRWLAPVYPAPVPNLIQKAADADTPPIAARDALDEVAQAAGWTMDTARDGTPRFRVWPLEPDAATPATVVDCAPGGVVADRITYVADTAALLNHVTMTNTAEATATAVDFATTGTHGIRSDVFGYPLEDVATATADLQAIVDRIRDRYGRIVNRVEAIEADTLQDAGWLPILAGLDTGRRLTVTRTHGAPATSTVVVVGYQHRLSKGRWRATIYTIPTGVPT